MLRYLLLLGAIAGVATYFLAFRPDLGQTEENLGAVASQIAGRPVSVNCQGLVSNAIDVTGNEGSVEFDEDGRPADVAELKRDVCTQLAKFTEMVDDPRLSCLTTEDGCPSDIDKLVVALHTIGHEAWHLRGVQDERLAECYALQTDDVVAVRLGASPAVARAMAVYYAHEKYPRLSSTYQSPACRDGGKYDLDRGSRVWP